MEYRYKESKTSVQEIEKRVQNPLKKYITSNIFLFCLSVNKSTIFSTSKGSVQKILKWFRKRESESFADPFDISKGKRRGCKKYDVRSFIYLTPIKGFRLGHPYSFQCMEDQKKKELCFVRWRYWFFFRREQNPESNFSDVKIRFSNHYVSHIPFRLQTPPDEHCSRNCNSAILHLWFKQKKDLYFHNISFI